MKGLPRFIPAGAREVRLNDLGVCYITDAPPTAIAYRGEQARKSIFYRSYRTSDRRDQDVAGFFADLKASVEAKAEQKAARERPHTLQVGDILHHSWGYDQTNCDFYQILAITPHGATIQAIMGQSVLGSGGMDSERLTAVPGAFVEKSHPFKVRISGHNRAGLDHGSAGKWDGTPKYHS